MLTRSAPTRAIEVPTLFRRDIKCLHRAAVQAPHCDLHKMMALQMLERRSFIRRDAPIVMEVGAHTGWYLRTMLQQGNLYGLKQYIQTDMSEARLNANYRELKPLLPAGVEFVQLCCDEEELGAFELPDRSVDQVVSCLSLHWVNRLEQCMVNIRKVMKRDAFCLVSMFGGNTLFELRSAFTLANTENAGGLCPHTSPMIDGTGVSALMLQSGFTMPSIDLDRYVLSYETPFHLMEHLRAMGETCAFNEHLVRPYTPRKTLLSMASIYQGMYGKSNLVPATFEVFHAVAWSPSPSQQQPLSPGSADLSFAQVGGTTQKEFAKALERSSRKPKDLELRARCEALFDQLQVQMEADRRKIGLGDEVDKINNVSPERESPAPPGQVALPGAGFKPLAQRRKGN
jgi:SAM-dependent methyltransferase